MLMKDLAEQLGISGSMVSRLAKRGMPTDSLERAQRWRKRHLEPGRVKGQRFEPGTGGASKPATRVAAPACADHLDTLADDREAARLLQAVEGAGKLLDAALFGIGKGGQHAETDRYRALLRLLPESRSPRLPVRVWVSLLDHLLYEENALRTLPHQAALLTIEEAADIINPDGGGLFQAGEWWGIACDWGGMVERMRAIPDADLLDEEQ